MADFFSLIPGADKIERWARFERNAEEELAVLIRSLIVHTAAPTRCDIPTGKAINQGGADGLITSPGRLLCPAGDSVWDWGVTDPDTKANSDYNDRTAATVESERLNSTFVFVTPWKWARSRTWEADRQAEGKWKGVKVIDSSDLVTWLDDDPATQIWLSERINGPMAGEIRSLESIWMHWSEEFWPPEAASPELILAGRSYEADRVRGWIGAPGIYTLLAASPLEGAAFVAAALMTYSANPDAIGLAAAVESEATWIKLIAAPRSPMILVPLFERPPYLKTAVSHGHTVIELAPLGSTGRFEAELPAPKEGDLVPVLLQMGLDADRAGKVASACGGSLVALQRSITSRGAHGRWTGTDAVRLLGPASFAGRWDESLAGDRAVLERLAGMSYEEFQSGLGAFTRGEDPALELVGSTWTATYQLDGLRSVGRDLAPARLDAFEAALREVLGAPDPAWELPEKDRWLANVKGKARPHSDGLRRGLASALAQIASQPEFARLAGGRSGQGIADRVVGHLLRAANEDPTGQRWADLEDHLSMLAEAAPNVFVEEVQHALEGDDPVLVKLMVEEPGMIMPRSRMPGLLWALERLAWSPDYLSAVVVILARLAEHDPGGLIGNRPAASLATILLPWHPQTSGDRAARLAAIEAARRVAPGPVWALMIRMLPKNHDIGGMAARPEWRPWAPAEDPTVTRGDYWGVVEDVLGLLVADAGADPVRWKDLIENYDDLPPELGERVLAGLEATGAQAFDGPGLELLSKTLSDVASNHRAFPDAQWVMPEERIQRVEAVASMFVPTDPVLENLWLFEHHPSTQRVSGRNYQDYENQLRGLRQNAVDAIYTVRGWSGVEELVAAAKNAYTVGAPVAGLEQAANDAILGWATSAEPARIEALAGYLWARTRRDGWAWAAGYLNGLAGVVPPDRLAGFVLAASRGPDAWALVHSLGEPTERAYWMVFDGYPDDADLWEATRKLLAFGRPFGAIQIIGTALTVGRGIPFDADLAFEALAAAVTTTVPVLPHDAAGVSHELGEIIKALDKSGYDAAKLADIEIPLLPFLEDQPGALKHVHERLANDPKLFIEAVEAVFRAEGEERPDQPDPNTEWLAQQAYRLLHGWHGPIPGQRADGSVDVAALNGWVDTVRASLKASGRATIGDQQIGHALWYAPIGNDEFHPHEAVRDVFERIASQEVEVGYGIEAVNSRGAVFRGRGGDQEREIATRHGDAASHFRDRWPQTAGIYRGLHDRYEHMARWEDDREALR